MEPVLITRGNLPAALQELLNLLHVLCGYQQKRFQFLQFKYILLKFFFLVFCEAVEVLVSHHEAYALWNVPTPSFHYIFHFGLRQINVAVFPLYSRHRWHSKSKYATRNSKVIGLIHRRQTINLVNKNVNLE